MVKVSIIITTYNREKFIKRTLESVLNQTFKDLEVIVVDDCSTDKTPYIIEEIKKNDNRVKLIRLSKNSGGPAKPRNEGLKIAKGHYVFLLDDDDLLLPTSIQERVEIFQNKNVNIINANTWVVDFKHKKIIDIINGNTSCLAFKSEIIKKIGFFDEELTGIDEIDFLIRYKLFFKENVFVFEKPTILYFRHGAQISGLNYNPDVIQRFIKRDILFLKKLDFLSKTIGEEKIPEFIESNYISIYFWLSYRYGLLGNFEEMKKYAEKLIINNKKAIGVCLKILSFIKMRKLNIILDIFLKKIKKIVFNYRKMNKFKKIYRESYNEAVKLLSNLNS
ncbi:MAG: glycosyltransferase family 2 protein [Patescibacteria group bacterium]